MRQKEAGIRTHIIVALGSALMMVVSKYGFFDVICYNSVTLDASRIAANIITGVSFLGSGMIIFKGSVKGLTTAAGVWATSGIGLAVGAGMYGISICATILLLVIQVCIHRLLPIENTITKSISVKLKDDPMSLTSLHDLLKKQGCDILSSNIEKKDGVLICVFNLKLKEPLTFEETDRVFSNNDYILSISM